MNKKRVIARLDVKNEHVIKGIHLEGLRKVGVPNEMAIDYYEQGVDEILFMDAVAAYYDRNSLSEIIREACKDVFVPITVGGGIRTIEDIQRALDCGADKVSINTQAIRSPKFITEAANIFGSQCIVASLDAKRREATGWEAYFDNGREPSGIEVTAWARMLEELGAGELLVTSIDMEGTKRGFDIELVELIASIVKIPVIASGGAGVTSHVTGLFSKTKADAVALASMLHYQICNINDLKGQMELAGVRVRI